MLLNSKSTISGKASIAVVVVVMAAILAGGLVLTRRASAQIPAAPPQPIDFAPVGMTTYTGDGVVNLTVKSFLPGVANATTPFRVEAFTNYATVSLDVPASPKGINEMTIFFADDGTGKTRLWIEDLATGAAKLSAPIGKQVDAYYVAMSIHPAVRPNGKVVYPLAAAESAEVSEFEVTEDFYKEWYRYTFEIMPAPLGGLGG